MLQFGDSNSVLPEQFFNTGAVLNLKLQFSIRTSLGGAPRSSAILRKSESAVTTTDPWLPAYSQIVSSGVR
jgi:hypothetical protein